MIFFQDPEDICILFTTSFSFASPNTVSKNFSLRALFYLANLNFSSFCCFFISIFDKFPGWTDASLISFYFFTSCFFDSPSFLTFDHQSERIWIRGVKPFDVHCPFLSPRLVNLSISLEFMCDWEDLLFDFDEVMKTSFAGTTFAKILKAWDLSLSRSKLWFQCIVPH